jgi:sec-independent protein translocase protein TatA
MIGDLFDSPWKILIIAVVLIILFGGRKMPDAARSLGRSMRILKAEVSDLHHDHEEENAPEAQPAQAITPPQPQQQQQIDQLQQQIRDLQQQQSAAGQAVTVNGASATETPQTQQPG